MLSTTRRCFSSSTTNNVMNNNVKSLIFPKNFKVSGVSAGIKKKKNVLDFALFTSEYPCTSAAVYTQNQFCAAPVIITKQTISQYPNDIYGVIVNSGCANACTGEQGLKDAQDTQLYASKEYNINNALVMSTGVIGPHLDMNKIRYGIDLAVKQLDNSNEAWDNASRAIMTTDTVPKLQTKQYTLDAENNNTYNYSIAGVAKGAGMIHPNMATMLSVICSDISISQPLLQEAVKYAADRSFNAISVDGDTSTNDTFAVLCNGQAGNKTITSSNTNEYKQFRSSLTQLSVSLAKQLVIDGEGATKFVQITVSNADTFNNARVIASSVSTSALVKTALFGQDANWGRVLCAVGYSGIKFDPYKVNLYFVSENDTFDEDSEGVKQINKQALSSSTTQSLHLVKDGRPYHIDEEIALKLLQQKNIYIYIDLGIGQAQATQWTCDFSYDYVKINADYRS